MAFKLLAFLPLFLALFLAVWLIVPQRWPILMRLCAVLFLLLCGAKMLIIPLSGRYMNNLPGPMLIAAAWGFALIAVGGVLALSWFVLGFAGRWFCPALWRPAVRLCLVGIPAVLLATYGVWQGIKVPEVRGHSIVIPNLPAELEGLRVAMLTDLHVGLINDAAWVTAVVERTNALKPDLVVIVGDVVDGSVAKLTPSVAPLAGLTAPGGVLYVPGNHEYYSGFSEWMNHFRSLGLRVLSNEHVVLPYGKSTLTVAGILDLAGRRYAEDTRPNLQAALQGRPVGSNNLTVLLSHQPLNAAENARNGIHLQLSGHTHGGSVLVLQSLIAGFNGGFVSGTYTVDAMRLFVSNGAGIWSGVPLRLGVPAEIALLRLTAEE